MYIMILSIMYYFTNFGDLCDSGSFHLYGFPGSTTHYDKKFILLLLTSYISEIKLFFLFLFFFLPFCLIHSSLHPPSFQSLLPFLHLYFFLPFIFFNPPLFHTPPFSACLLPLVSLLSFLPIPLFSPLLQFHFPLLPSFPFSPPTLLPSSFHSHLTHTFLNLVYC